MALKKLKIVGYEDKAFSIETGNSFTMMVNPASYDEKKGIRYSKDEAIDGGNTPTYQGYQDETMTIDFMIDATGVLTKPGDGNFGKTIPEMVAKIEKTVYVYVGDAHEPPYLQVEWGTLHFQGRLKDMNVKSVMFTPDGLPIRSKVTMNLVKYMDEATQKRLKNKSSPDLSHLVTVKAGDTLPGLCLRIYKSAVYCTDVAYINGLNGFRRLEPGIQLLFPPLANE